MTFDPDLTPLLQSSTNEDLAPLVEYILSAKTNALQRNVQFVASRPDHQRYIDLIGQEIQTFGGNSFANIRRGGKGVPYAEVVHDVAKRIKVPHREGQTVAEIEQAVIFYLFDIMVSKMSPAERKRLEDEFRAAGWKHADFSAGKPIFQALTQAGVRVTGFLMYRISVTVANRIAWEIIGRGLSLAVNAWLTKALSVFAGPVGWTISGLWTAFDLAEPAYRVTVPCVLHVAYLRAKLVGDRAAKINEVSTETAKQRVPCEYCGHIGWPIEYRNERPICAECGAPLPSVL